MAFTWTKESGNTVIPDPCLPPSICLPHVKNKQVCGSQAQPSCSQGSEEPTHSKVEDEYTSAHKYNRNMGVSMHLSSHWGALLLNSFLSLLVSLKQRNISSLRTA